MIIYLIGWLLTVPHCARRLWRWGLEDGEFDADEGWAQAMILFFGACMASIWPVYWPVTLVWPRLSGWLFRG